MPQEMTANYLDLRIGTRTVLNHIGVPSNPGVSDEWIVNQLRRKADLPLIKDYEKRPEDDFTLFQNSLLQIIVELGGDVNTEQHDQSKDLEPGELIHVLHGLFV